MNRSSQVSGDRARQRYVLNGTLAAYSLGFVLLTSLLGYFWYQHRSEITVQALQERAKSLENEGKLDQAVSYYRRYLLADPENTEALLRLVDIYSSGERTGARLTQLNRILYRTLGRLPERADLRLLLSQNLFELRAFEEAEAEATQVLQANTAEAPEAQKIIALSRAARMPADSSLAAEDVLGELLQSVEQLPNDVLLVSTTAMLLREHPEAAPSDVTNAPNEADALVDRLVKNSPNSAEARLARYRYSSRYRLPAAEDDLGAALEIDPDNVEALLIRVNRLQEASEEALGENSEATIRKIIELASQDPRGYLALANFLREEGKPEAALVALEQGLERLRPSLELGIAKVELLLALERFEQAEKTLRATERENTVLLSQLDSQLRQQILYHFSLLAAKIALADDEHEKAISELLSITVNAEPQRSTQGQRIWAEANYLLAQVYSAQGKLDKSIECWERLLEEFPANVNYVTGAASTYIRSGLSRSALQTVRKFHESETPTAESSLSFLQALFALQSGMASASRDWSEFETTLAQTKAEFPQLQKVVFLECQYLTAVGSPNAAAALLRVAETGFAAEASLWRNAVLTYADLGEIEDLKRTLVRFREAESDSAQQAIVEAIALARLGDFQQADALLERLLAAGAGERTDEVLRLRFSILGRAGERTALWDLLKESLAADSENKVLLAMAAELAIGAGEWEAASSWQGKLSDLTDAGFEARYLDALLQVERFRELSQAQRQELAEILVSLRRERPHWYPLAALSGRYHLLSEDSRQALEGFRDAVELGDRREATLEQLVLLLMEFGRFDEADRYFALASVASSGETLLGSSMVELASRQGKGEIAIELARKRVQSSPADPASRIFLAEILGRQGRPAEAVEVLEKAVKTFPADARVWSALLRAHRLSGSSEAVLSTLSIVLENEELSAGWRNFVAAQGQEMLRDLPAAEMHYRIALAELPEEVEIRYRFAQLLANTNPRAAVNEFERVLELEPDHTNAKRQLAVLLASTGEQGDWLRATQLLSTIDRGAGVGSREEERLRAVLLSHQGRTRSDQLSNCRQARSAIEALIETAQGPEKALDFTVLAHVLERHASLSRDASLLVEASKQLHQAYLEGGRVPSRLLGHIEFLLKYSQRESQAGTKTMLELAPPERETFLSEAETAIAALEGLGVRQSDKLDGVLVILKARLALNRGDEDKAKGIVNRFAKQQDFDAMEDQQKLERYYGIARLFSSLGLHADAETWYRKMVKISPNALALLAQSIAAQGKRDAAINLCLDQLEGKPDLYLAKVIASLMTVNEREISEREQPAEAEAAVDAAVAAFPEDLQLLQAVAVMHASRGNYQEAIKGFRKILAINPQDALALNNLATLLAESPNQRAEALDLVEQAIRLFGHTPGLMDTKGTIHLKLGEAEEAIRCLEEATAGGNMDARYYLHLAAAYQLGERSEEARAMLHEARGFGISDFVLTQDDRAILDSLEASLLDNISVGAKNL